MLPAATLPYRRAAAIISGPLLGLATWALLARHLGEPPDLSEPGRVAIGIMVWMAVWWITEAVHVSVTALLPAALFPMIPGIDSATAFAPYAHPLIFMFLGCFFLALALQRWEIDQRIALYVLRISGTRLSALVAGSMVATAGLSAFISNTATAAMMLPIALSLVALAAKDGAANRNFERALLLGIAYAASIGGMATLVGTPPNAILAAFLSDQSDPALKQTLTMAGWMKMTLPLVLVFLPLTWLLLTRVLYPLRGAELPGGRRLISEAMDKLGTMKPGSWISLALFVLMVASWMLHPLITKPLGFKGGDTVVALVGAILLFVIPCSRDFKVRVLDWDTAVKAPWGVLILFGGGLSLASVLKKTGVPEFIAHMTVADIDLPAWLLIALISAMILLLTEVTSNTATAATMIPILAGMALPLGIDPILLLIPATLAASCAFMMPVATPPNAIVFGSGKVSMREMNLAGLLLNIVGVVLITLLAVFWLGG